MNSQFCLYFPKHGIVYINNPKAGCSTIKRALTGDYETINRDFHAHCHEKHGVSNLRKIKKDTPTIFIGRDPVKRFHSCFQDKISATLYRESIGEKNLMKHARMNIIKAIRSELNLPDRTPINIEMFIEFVRYEFESNKAASVNAHYRPQHLIIRQSGRTPDFVGRLEDMPDLWEELQSKYSFSAPIKRSVNVSKWKKPLTSSQISAIQQIYAADMDFLNY